MKITKTILFSLFSLLFINAGLNKFLNYMPVPENLPEEMLKDATAMMEIAWLMPLIAIVEIISGVLILIPRMRALGVLMVFPVMVGILLTHTLVEPSGLPVALIIWVIMIWMIVDNWHKYKPLLND